MNDAIGDGPTRLGGRVTGEVPGGLVGPGLADVFVIVHQAAPGGAPASGKPVAHARTDAQGKFHLSVILPPGTYDVAVHATEDGPPLASRRLVLEDVRPRRLEDLHLEVPAVEDPAAGAPAVEDPAAGAPAR